MEWIALKDKMPEFDKPVIVGCPTIDLSFDFARLDSVVQKKNGVEYTWYTIRFAKELSIPYKPTHWMELPECLKY